MPAIRFGDEREITSDKIVCARCKKGLKKGSKGRYEHKAGTWHCTPCADIIIQEYKPLDLDKFLEPLQHIALALQAMTQPTIHVPIAPKNIYLDPDAQDEVAFNQDDIQQLAERVAESHSEIMALKNRVTVLEATLNEALGG